MNFIVKKIIGGVLYIDKEIVCIKYDRIYLKVFKFLPYYQEILTLELAKRTNKIGRYSNGIYYFQDKITFFHSFLKGVEKKIKGKFYYRYKSNYKSYLTIDNRDEIIFELERKIIVPVIQHGEPKLFLENGLVQAEQEGTGDGSIYFHDISMNGNELWSNKYSVLSNSSKGNLHSQILCSHDKLFFVITGNKNKGLYILNVHTGKLLKKFEGVCYEVFQDGDYIFSSRFENTLCRINTKTLVIEEWDCNELIKSNGFDAIHDHRCAALNNKFYFTQTLGDNKAKVGILDWDKQDLVYKHDFKPKNGGIGSIQVNENRMFIHTQDNTLHIFEKETE
ncbi:DUF5074 domain-containing protein [Marivirga tractuosa]|uniref:hypothetical protein n=1 Tax=Marivirga tractuosa TaxID=1006 RepID=UPI0035D0DE19